MDAASDAATAVVDWLPVERAPKDDQHNLFAGAMPSGISLTSRHGAGAVDLKVLRPGGDLAEELQIQNRTKAG
jgi:hypothetical protein